MTNADVDGLRLPPVWATAPVPVGTTERANRQLRSAIASLVLQPGRPITERDLADWLGIGRMPVREALVRLREDGLVEAVPRQGYSVSSMSADDAREIYELIEGLESIVVKLATERAMAQDIESLEATVRDQEAALARDDLDAWVTADEAFHDAIVEIARNQRIQRVSEPLNAQLHRLRLFTIRLRSKPTQSVEEHWAVLEAIRAGDGELGRRIHQDHRARTRGLMIEILQKYAGPGGGW